MAKRAQPKAGKIQFVWEGILKWSAFSIMCLQLSMGILMYLLPDDYVIASFKAEKWGVVLLFIAVCVYVGYTKAKAPRLMFRIKDFTKGLFRPELIILSVFFVWNIFCTMSADSRYAYNFFALNDYSLFDTFLSVFIIFIMAYIFRGESAWKMLEILFHVFCAVLTLFMIYVLYTIFKPDLIELPGGVQIGMSNELRLCINCHPNTTGAIAELILLMCVYMIVTKKGLLRWLYAAAAVVHYLVLIMSNSRTCVIASGIAVAVIVGKLCYDALKDRFLWQRILVTALAAGITASVFIGLRKPIFAAHESISHISTYLASSAPGKTVDVAREAEMTFNKRTELWVGALKSIFQDAKHIFFGVTPAGVTSEISIWAESHRQMYTHNQFLEVAVAHGIPGLIMFLVWLGMIAKSCVNAVSGKIKGMHKGLIVLAGMILMMVTANLTEATLMYYQWFPEGVFFLFCGMITYKKEA